MYSYSVWIDGSVGSRRRPHNYTAGSTPVNSKRAPPRSASVTATSYPWAAAMSWTIVSPNPLLSSVVEYPALKTLSRSASGIPGPSSST